MRLGVGLALAAGLLAACSGNADVAAKFGCGPVNGLKALMGEKPPTYVLVGEFVETNEAPAAFGELACQLAAHQTKDKPLWVGLSEYAGGTTEADRKLRMRLDDLSAKGLPIVIGSILEGHPTSARDRNSAEQYWAEIIMANVKSVGAGRALLLMPRVDGVAERVWATSERYADYYPMALFLPQGEVFNLEIGQTQGLAAPTIRVYRTMAEGYMGQLSLAELTPAPTTTADAGEFARPWPRGDGADLSQEMIFYVARSGLPREKQLDVLSAYVALQMTANRKARIEARRQLSINHVDEARIDTIAPDPFSEAPVTEYGAMAHAETAKMLEAFEKRQEQGTPLPWGTTDRSILRQRMPRSLVDMVEKELGYVPN